MKKSLLLVLVLLVSIIFVLSACRESSGSDTTKDVEITDVTEITEESEADKITETVKNTEDSQDSESESISNGNETDLHTHSFSDWKVLKDATCTQKGEKEGTCSCGEKEKTDIPAVGHTEVIDKGYADTCTTDGLTDGKHCSVCNEVLVEQTVIESKGHTEVTDKGYNATCTEDGLTDGKHCSVCNEVLVEQTVIESKGHSEVIDKGYNATCTTDGLTDGKHCSVCNEVLVEQTVIESKGHTEVTDKGYNATCTEDGLTDGKHCSTCNEVLVEQTVIESKGHSEVTDKGYNATCTEDGLTDGKHCSTCNEVLVEQTVIESKGHTEVIDKGYADTCTTDGLTDGKHCSVCNEVLVEQTVIESKGHTEVTDKGYNATCTEDGLTDGKHCSVCNEVLVEQTVIESKGHSEVTDKGYNATCTEDGLTDGKHCSTCNEVLVEQTVIESKGHTEVIDKGYADTCTTDGLTDGKHCSVCNEVLVEQTVIESKGHTEVTDKGYNATCTEDGLTDGKHCSVCNEVLVEQTVIESKGHLEVIDPAKAPTCTEIGWTEAKICQICELVLSERTYIRKMGHNVVDGDCIRCDYQRIDFTDISIYFSDYGYNYLGTLTNGEKMQELYNRFDAIAREFHSNSVTSETLDKITCSDLGLKLEDCRMAFSRFIYDRPIYYWLTGSYDYYYNTTTNVITGIILKVAPEYSNGATRAEYNSIIYKGAEEFYSIVETEESIYNTVLAYYDLIISKINYAYDSNGKPEDSIWAHRIVGVFSEQGVVCEGYAKTLQLMLNVSKISNIYISGDAGGGHAWSLVRLDDGKWYWFDSTWDDSGDQYSDRLAGKQYFALVDTSVDLKDRVFIDSHVPTIDNNWGWPSLPERAEDSFDDADIVEALQTFTVGANTYQVVGYYKVHLIKSTVISGTAIIPDSVFYEGDFYDVIGSGTLSATGQVVFDVVFDYYSISELTFADGIVRIQGINNCKKLTTVRIPKSTKYIIMYAFAYCNNLTTIYYDGTVEEWNAIEKGSDWNIGCGTITVYCSDGNVTV